MEHARRRSRKSAGTKSNDDASGKAKF